MLQKKAKSHGMTGVQFQSPSMYVQRQNADRTSHPLESKVF